MPKMTAKPGKMPAVKMPKSSAVSVKLVKPTKPAFGGKGMKAGKKGC